MSKQLLSVAIADPKLYKSLEPAFDATGELEHLRQSIIRFVEPEDEGTSKFFDGLSEYGLEEVDRCYAKLDALYRQCTGKKLESHRLR